MTADGEERIPFHAYVQPITTQKSSFSQFSQLPTEIQFRILAFCSAPALFQLMHVSSTLRIEAAKLFWTDPYTYYLIESDWLFKGGYPGNTHYDLSFLSHIQNVEIEYLQGADFRIDPIRPAGQTDIQHELVSDFWSTFRRRFQRARKVIINQNWVPHLDREPVGLFSHALTALVTACPPDIDVSVSIREDKSPNLDNANISLPKDIWYRSLHRHMPDGGWRKVPLYLDRTTLSMPIKTFHGPVGAYQKVWYWGNKLHLQRIALGFLIIEALDRYHFDDGELEPFSCPVAGCDAYFKRAGQWTLHATRMHRPDLIANEEVTETRLRMVPEELKECFKRHERNLVSKDIELAREVRRIQHEWNKEGPEKRRHVKSAWMNQLENDNAWWTGTEARESELWKRFTRTMAPGWWDGFLSRYRE